MRCVVHDWLSVVSCQWGTLMVANQGDCGRLEVGLGGSSVEDARLLAEMVDLVGGLVQGEIGGNVLCRKQAKCRRNDEARSRGGGSVRG